MSSYDKKFIQQCAETWIAIGTCADTIGQVEKAVEAFSTVLRYTPNNAKALTHLAHVYRTRDAYAEAADLYRRALALDQHNGETWGLLGHCYLMLDDLQSAYTAYQQALLNLQNLSVPKLWHGIGILYDRYGSLEYAEEAFVRVLEMDPNFDKANEVYFRLGIIYKLQGKLQKALECFQYILNRPPAPLTQTDVWFQIGTVLEQNRDFTGSKEAYERVLQSSPNHSKVLQQLGGLYSQPEAPFYDLDIALQLLNQSIELNNSDAHSWYYLGRVYMSKQDYPNAYESFQHAVNLDSRNPTFWCSIGVLYYKISQYKDALDAYTRAIRLNPYLSEVWYDLGTLYETCNNQIGDALDAYRRAASLDPDNPHIAERLMQLSKYEKEGGALPPPVQTQHQLTMPSHQMIQQQQQQQQQQQHQLNPANGLPLGQQFQLGNAPNLIHQQSNEQRAQAEAQRQAEVQRQAEAQRLAEQQQQQQLAEAQRKAEFDAEEKRKAEAEAEATKRAAGLQKQAEMKAEEEKKQAEKVKKEKAKKEKKDAEEKEKEAQRQRQRQLEINSENRKQAQQERELEMEKQRKFAETAEAEAKAKAEADAETAANAAADAKIKADEEAREQARIHAESEAQAQAQAQAQAEVEAEAENQAKVQAEAEAEANARQLLEAEKVIEPKPETNGAEAVKPPSQGGSQSAGIKSEEQQDSNSKATSNEVPSSAETSNPEFKGEKRPLEDSDINGNGNTMNGEKKQKITDGKESKENTAPESSNGVLKTNTQSESVPAVASRDVPLEHEQGVDRDNGDDKSGQKDEEKTIDLKPMEVDDVAELKSIAKDKEEELEKKDDNVDAAGIAQNENKVRKIDEDEDYDD